MNEDVKKDIKIITDTNRLAPVDETFTTHHDIVDSAQFKPSLTAKNQNDFQIARINRTKQDYRTRFISPENRLGTQLRPLRVSKENLMIDRKIDEFKIRPETEKAHKRILSSGLGTSKLSTGAPTKQVYGFGISGRSVYGKHTPLNMSNISAEIRTPANEYEDTSKSWVMKQKQMKLREDIERKSHIAKTREIERIMKRLGKAEQERNVTVFRKLIREEKELHKELLQLDKNQRQKEMLRKKYLIFRANKRRSLARVDREFALSFAHHKNVIEKHASMGEKRRRENEYIETRQQRRGKNRPIHLKRVSDDSSTSEQSFIKSQKYFTKQQARRVNL